MTIKQKLSTKTKTTINNAMDQLLLCKGTAKEYQATYKRDNYHFWMREFYSIILNLNQDYDLLVWVDSIEEAQQSYSHHAKMLKYLRANKVAA